MLSLRIVAVSKPGSLPIDFGNEGLSKEMVSVKNAQMVWKFEKNHPIHEPSKFMIFLNKTVPEANEVSCDGRTTALLAQPG
jgi:hypothetical protein